jgi:hypothetical protein
MAALLGEPYAMTKASYDLARLSRNQLITRICGANTFQLRGDGAT